MRPPYAFSRLLSLILLVPAALALVVALSLGDQTIWAE